jgi:hypothetical protein
MPSGAVEKKAILLPLIEPTGLGRKIVSTTGKSGLTLAIASLRTSSCRSSIKGSSHPVRMTTSESSRR